MSFESRIIEMNVGQLSDVVGGGGACIEAGVNMMNFDPKANVSDPEIQAAAKLCGGCAVYDECKVLGIREGGFPGAVYGGILYRSSGSPVDILTGDKVTKKSLKDSIAPN